MASPVKNIGECSVGGCCIPSKTKGLCRKHYMRLRSHGDPLGGSTGNGEPLAFIHDVAVPSKGDECLIWPFAKDRKGYARVYSNGRLHNASRYVCQLVHGDPPSEGLYAAHECGKGDTGCVNPRHLSWKTPKENQADRLVHGTHEHGERNAMAKLTSDQALEIIRLKGVMSQTKLAKRFGVCQTNISQIQNRKTWVFVDEGEAK